MALFIDFDGTLVDIAPTPAGIHVPDRLPKRLTRLSRRLGDRVALVSGRSLDDLFAHLGSPNLAAAGSHGADRRLRDGESLGDRPRGLPQSVRNLLVDLSREHGFSLEDKPHGMALHFRDRPELASRGDELLRPLAANHGIELKRGKAVFELVRPGAEKGGAVRAFMKIPPFVGARPVFVGDDVTDEDGFRAAQAMDGLAILVGDRRPTDATFSLADPAALHAWLGL